MELTTLTSKIQVKLHQFCNHYQSAFSRPDHKFIKQMIFGILKSGQVQLNAIGRSLQESQLLKDTTKRLGRHLSAAGLWYRVSFTTLRAQCYYLKQCRYMIIDLSDIQKRYARKMSGLSHVHDGSEDKIGPGYWQCNVSGVTADGSQIVPAYSELYSLQEESSSENKKILSSVTTISRAVGKKHIWVIDRGGDRRKIMQPLILEGHQFVIRQRGDRDLYCNGEKQPLKAISRKVKLTKRFHVRKVKHNRRVEEVYDCGAARVRLEKKGPPLWLVVIKERRKGYCWLLCHLKCSDKDEAIKEAFTGYGHRWKIEEVHRQIKSDYELESICLQRYEALKTMNSLLWAAVSFLYTRLETLSLEIIYHKELALVNRKRTYDLLRFIYYKLAHAVKKLLSLSRFKEKTLFPSQSIYQLRLALE